MDGNAIRHELDNSFLLTVQEVSGTHQRPRVSDRRLTASRGVGPRMAAMRRLYSTASKARRYLRQHLRPEAIRHVP